MKLLFLLLFIISCSSVPEDQSENEYDDKDLAFMLKDKHLMRDHKVPVKKKLIKVHR